MQNLEDLPAAIDQITTDLIVVKSQIHAGGRGKGTFTDGFQGGVKLAKSRDEAIGYGEKMLGNTLVTKQTGPAGRKVQTLYINEGSAIKKEYYLAILLDRATSRPVIVASTEGGVEIEEVANNTPEKITKVFIDPAYRPGRFPIARDHLQTWIQQAGRQERRRPDPQPLPHVLGNRRLHGRDQSPDFHPGR